MGGLGMEAIMVVRLFGEGGALELVIIVLGVEVLFFFARDAVVVELVVLEGYTGGVGEVATRVGEGWVVEAVGGVGDEEAEEGASDDVGRVVSVVHGAGDGDEGCGHEGGDDDPDGEGVRGATEVGLCGEEEGEEGEAGEGG